MSLHCEHDHEDSNPDTLVYDDASPYHIWIQRFCGSEDITRTNINWNFEPSLWLDLQHSNPNIFPGHFQLQWSLIKLRFAAKASFAQKIKKSYSDYIHKTRQWRWPWRQQPIIFFCMADWLSWYIIIQSLVRKGWADQKRSSGKPQIHGHRQSNSSTPSPQLHYYGGYQLSSISL